MPKNSFNLRHRRTPQIKTEGTINADTRTFQLLHVCTSLILNTLQSNICRNNHQREIFTELLSAELLPQINFRFNMESFIAPSFLYQKFEERLNRFTKTFLEAE